MANHVIIGLGGTGGKVLRELRKRVYEEFGSNSPKNGIHLEYIYLDSSKADIDESSKWKVMGKNVGLAPAQQVSTHGISASMFQNIEMYPGVASFMNNNELNMFTSKLGSLISEGIGGQRRRLGRVLLANNLADRNSNRDFLTRLKQTVQRICAESGDNNVTFHICAGLAGGTGSGSVVDIISQIRNEYPPYPQAEGGQSHSINLYLYVPEAVLVNPSHDREGFYQSNGYAALCEINAMSVGAYNPYDITGKTDPFTGIPNRMLIGKNAFEAAYLYSNVNEAGKVLDLATTLPQSVADFIFQKTVAVAMVSNGKLSRLQGCENDGAGPELDRSGKATRSRKFLSFGIKRIEYPETEISEYVTYNYARQAARQMEYNLWHDGIGYDECSIDEVGSGFASEISDTKNRERLMLSNAYLMLSKPIIESKSTKNWKDISPTWETRTQAFADDVQNSEDKKSWLAAFSKLCEDYYTSQYRVLGVEKFFEIQKGERIAYAKHIRSHIESLLFDEWVIGGKAGKSLLEIEKYVILLISDCKNRIQAFDEQIARVSDAKNECINEIKQCNIDWDHIGWVRDTITGVSKKVFSAYKTAKCEYYSHATRIVAYNYAKSLLQTIVEQLGMMLEGIKLFHKQLSEIIEEVNKQAESRCSNGNLTSQLTDKKYNPELIRQIAKTYITDRDKQDSTNQAIRQKMVSLLGEDADRSFASLCSVSDIDTTTDIILDICGENARMAMENTAKEDPLQKLVNVNILEKIKQEYNTDEKLASFVKNIVQEAQTYIQFNTEEKAKVLNGATTMMDMIQLCLPVYENDNSGFRNKLINMFVQYAPGFNPSEDVTENYKSNQIVVIAAKSGFPLRYIYNIQKLKDRYDEITNNASADLNKLVLHTETFTEGLPSLFELGFAEIRRMVEKPVIIAYMLGLINSSCDPTTGETFEAMLIDGPLGPEPKRLGKDIIDTMDYLGKDYSLAQQLMALVSQKAQVMLRSNEQKEAAKQKLISILNENILKHPSCENNMYSPVYAKYKSVAMEILNSELKPL